MLIIFAKSYLLVCHCVVFLNDHNIISRLQLEMLPMQKQGHISPAMCNWPGITAMKILGLLTRMDLSCYHDPTSYQDCNYTR